MTETARFLALVLATWRLSSLLAFEEGPLGLFERVRDLCSATEFLQRTIGRGIVCQWCNSVWVGASFAVWICAGPWYTWSWWPIWSLALSAGAIVLDCVVEKLERGGVG